MLNVHPPMIDRDELKATMSRDARLKGPAVVAVCTPKHTHRDLTPARNTRETFASLGVELGLREVSVHG
jgi:hypothetical protein